MISGALAPSPISASEHRARMRYLYDKMTLEQKAYFRWAFVAQAVGYSRPIRLYWRDYPPRHLEVLDRVTNWLDDPTAFRVPPLWPQLNEVSGHNWNLSAYRHWLGITADEESRYIAADQAFALLMLAAYQWQVRKEPSAAQTVIYLVSYVSVIHRPRDHEYVNEEVRRAQRWQFDAGIATLRSEPLPPLRDPDTGGQHHDHR